MYVQGTIIAGEFDSTMNEYSLQQVKNLNTESVLKESQLKHVYDYLKKHQMDEDGQIITLYDQMPVRLSQDEVNDLINDIEKILPMYH